MSGRSRSPRYGILTRATTRPRSSARASCASAIPQRPISPARAVPAAVAVRVMTSLPLLLHCGDVPSLHSETEAQADGDLDGRVALVLAVQHQGLRREKRRLRHEARGGSTVWLGRVHEKRMADVDVARLADGEGDGPS